jgi:hypothetical protein
MYMGNPERMIPCNTEKIKIYMGTNTQKICVNGYQRKEFRREIGA